MKDPRDKPKGENLHVGSPEYNAKVTEEGINFITGILTRGLITLQRIIPVCCLDEVIKSETQVFVHEIANSLHELGKIDPSKVKNNETAMTIMKQVSEIGLSPLRKISSKYIPNESPINRIINPEILLSPSSLNFIVTLPGLDPPQIPPDKAAEILRKLLELLEEVLQHMREDDLLDPNTEEEFERLLFFLRQYIRDLVAAGLPLTLPELQAFLKPLLDKILAILTRCLSSEALTAFLARLLQVLVLPLSEFAGYSLGYVLGGVAIAGVVGWIIGRLIGHIPIGGGRTIDDAVTDFFTWLFYGTISADCWSKYYDYRKREEERMQYEQSGGSDKNVKIGLIAMELVAISRYIACKCPDQEELSRLNQLKDILEQKLKKLAQ